VTIPQQLLYQQASNIHLDLRSRPSAITVGIYNGDGAAIQDHVAANVSGINTTLRSTVTAGDRAINVAANTGMSSGMTCWIQDVPEELLIRSIAGTTVTLGRPTLRSHANVAAVEGSRAWYQCGANIANSLWWDGHAAWNVAGSMHYTALDCGRYPLQRLASAQDMFDIEPALYEVLDAESDPERLLDAAHEHVLSAISRSAPDKRARLFVGSQEFRTATALAAMYIHFRRRHNPEAQALCDRYSKDLQSSLDALVGAVPRDTNQDGVIAADEGVSFRSVRLSR
jgi:prepilin-type processing-associated H-X9-DG protein